VVVDDFFLLSCGGFARDLRSYFWACGAGAWNFERACNLWSSLSLVFLLVEVFNDVVAIWFCWCEGFHTTLTWSIRPPWFCQDFFSGVISVARISWTQFFLAFLGFFPVPVLSSQLLCPCYRSVCRIGLVAWRQESNWCNMSFPTHCHLNGELFLFRVANPKGDVPSNLGFWRKRIKGLRLKGQSKLFPHRLLPREIVKVKVFHWKGTCLRDKANETKMCSSG